MQSSNPNPFSREDTLLGVCQAIGEDFGFNPVYLRIALGVSLLWNPFAVVITYLTLGAAVLVGRLVAPVPKHSKGEVRNAPPASVEKVVVAADNSENEDDLRVAA